MSRHLYIAGVDRVSDLEKGSLRIEQALTFQIDTCSFSIKGEQPAEGEEVIVEDDELGRLFAGIIVKVELGRIFPDKSIKVWNVDCDDYTALLDRRLVVETYENMSASDIFLDIVAKYCPGFTVTGVRPGAPVIESTGAEFEYKPPSECFKWLCDYVGWHWQPDYYKDLHFFSAEELASPAPLVLRPGGKFRFGKHSIDTQGLRNRVYVRGGTMLSDPQVVQWKADGVARIWTLPWGPHEVSLAVGEAPMTVGVENLHDEADFDYMMSFSEKYIRCSAQTPTPVEGTTISLTARQDIAVITMVEDYASQTAIAAVQGGDGIYEHVIDDDSLTTIQAAEAAGMADLREHANPRVSGSFETEYYAPAVYETVQVGEEFIGWQTELEQEASDMAFYLWYDSSVAQSFIVEGSLVGAKKVRVSVLGSDREGIYPQRIDFHIYTDNNGQPGNSISTAGYFSIPGGNWPVNPEWLTGEIDLDEPLQGGQQYWLVLVGSGGIDSVKVRVAFDPLPNSTFATKPDSMWELRSDLDMAFKVEAPVYEPIYEEQLVTPAHIWQPGQIVEINLPDRGVEGEFLIQRVTITPTWSNPSIWTFRVEYGGRLFGIADFLKALVSAQQKKQLAETAIISKFDRQTETAGVTDTVTDTPRNLPYRCRDPDALCGFVQLDNGGDWVFFGGMPVARGDW